MTLKKKDAIVMYEKKDSDLKLAQLLPGYVTIAQYAKKRGIHATQVYRAIGYGNIVAVPVGMDKAFSMIHWELYKEVSLEKPQQTETSNK